MTSATHNTLLLPVIIGLLVSACGAEFAYKRGADRNDLESSKKACAAQAGDASTMEKCLEGHGWVMQNFNDTDREQDPVIDVTPSDNRGYVAPATSKSTNVGESVHAGNPATSGKPAGEVTSGETAAPSSPVKPSVVPPSAVKKPADPMDTFKVSSWWKLGSGPEGLKPAVNECVTTLGEAHKPDESTHLVTRGLLVCMAGKGWRGLREK